MRHSSRWETRRYAMLASHVISNLIHSIFKKESEWCDFSASEKFFELISSNFVQMLISPFVSCNMEQYAVKHSFDLALLPKDPIRNLKEQFYKLGWFKIDKSSAAESCSLHTNKIFTAQPSKSWILYLAGDISIYDWSETIIQKQ